MLYKNAAQKIHVYAYDATTGAAKTGDAAQITAYVSLDGTANAVDDTNPTEVDATNMPGVYAFDLTAAETNCEAFALVAKSSTSNIRLDPIIGYTAGVNATKIGDTAQTGRDIGASVLLSVGTGTGQVNLSSGKVPATVATGDAPDVTRLHWLLSDVLRYVVSGNGSIGGSVAGEYRITGFYDGYPCFTRTDDATYNLWWESAFTCWVLSVDLGDAGTASFFKVSIDNTRGAAGDYTADGTATGTINIRLASPASLDWDADVTNPPTIGTSTLTAQNVRDALKLAPSAGDPAAGSIDKQIDDVQTVTDKFAFSGTNPYYVKADTILWGSDDLPTDLEEEPGILLIF